jgi:hypothetical protein
VVESRRGRCLGSGGSVCVARAWTARRMARGGEENQLATGGSFLRGGGGHQRGGVRQWRCHVAWGGVEPGFDQRAASRPTVARAGGAPLFRQWHADVADAWASAVGGRGSEMREARARVGWPGETWSGPSLNEQ